jgi:hypothetical protein
MSLEHNNLTDALLKSDAVRKDPSIVPRLQQSLRYFRDMARLAVTHEGAYEDSANESPVPSGSVEDLTLVHPGAVLQSLSRRPDTSPSSAFAVTTRADESALVLLQDISQAGSTPLHYPAYFTENWMSYGPWSVPPRVAPPSVASLSMARQACPFGLRVLRNLLNIAYYSLVGQYGHTYEVAQSIFRFAFLDFTPHELSFILRWYLGPGKDELPCLGFATSVFNASYEVEGKPTIQSLPLARNANKGGYYTPFTPAFEEDYVSLFELDGYLRDLGVFEINQHTFSMLTTLPKPILSISPNATGSLNSKPTISRPQGPPNMFSFDNFFGQRSTSLSLGSSPSAGLIAGSTSDIIEMGRPQVFTVSIEKFLRELSSITVCLGHGPALMRRLVQPAIMASVTEAIEP